MQVLRDGDLVSEVEVRSQLDRIVGSETFGRAERLRRFLVYVVEEALAGRAQRLKEYTLGIEVFDRGESFDPRSDPIVRVDARRLRARLERYYAEEGAGDAVEIRFARGGYAPRFQRRLIAEGPAEPKRAEPLRLAVLPFRHLGADPAQQAFAEAIAEDIALSLGRRPGLRVIGQASVARAGEPSQDLAEVGRRLGAELIISGTLRRDGAQLRIGVSLLAAKDGTQLWSEREDVTITEAEQMLALQDRIAEQMADRLTPRVYELSAAQRAPPTRDIAAYELFLRGRHQLQVLSPLVLPQAAEFLQAALQRDPDFALARTTLADVQFARAVFLLAPPVEAMQTSRELAREALRTNGGLAAAHARLAVLSTVLDHDFAAAADGFARALSLDPMAADVRQNRATWLLAPLGRLDEAAAELTALLEQDPYSLWLRVDLGRVLLYQRRYADAIGQLSMVLDMEPRFGVAMYHLACAYEHAGDIDRARAAHERHVNLLPYPLVTRWFGAASAVWAGDADRAAKLVGEMEADATAIPAAATVIADAYLRLGDHPRAIDWLERAAEQRHFRTVYFAADPDYAALRRAPRFAALLRRIGLASARRQSASAASISASEAGSGTSAGGGSPGRTPNA